MTKLRVPGVADASLQPSALAAAVPEVRAGRSIRVEAGRAGQRPEEIDSEFVELELAGGTRLWAPTDRIAADLGAGPTRGDEPPTLPVVFPTARRARDGGGNLAIRAVRAFEVEIAGAIADFIRTRVEAGREPGGELRQCVTSSAEVFDAPRPLSGTGPVLVFLHGTASSTGGSFGGLWEAVGANRVLRIDNPGARINELFKVYDGRVLAFEHRSLSESPIVNAEALATQLAGVVPGGTELHLVSHSRGGLIGELLCRGMRNEGTPFDATDLGLFQAPGRDDDRRALDALGGVLTQQQYAITRFVRVACPAAGTTLADERLDRYVSMLVNVAGRVSGLAADPTYKALTSLLAAVLKERTKPDKLPGLEAMMPTSPLTRLINRRDVVTSADLHVLGGDLAIRGVWSALTALATDFYYREDHDLVVNTPSMLRGARRRTPVQYWIDTDGDVTHFNYFRRPDTASRLAGVLATGKADFRQLDVEPHEVTAGAYQKRDGARRPVLFVVPGFMGSHLAVEGERIWADTARLARGEFARLAVAAAPTPEALVGTYAGLVRHLSASHDVVPFPYDWRLTAATNAARFADAITKRLDAKDADPLLPVRLLTHGSGSLVFQAMLASDTGRAVWDRVCRQPGARAVLLGPPFGGVAAAAVARLGRGPLFEGLAAIDLVNDAAALQRMFASFAGLLELLPAPDVAAPPPLDPTRVSIVVGTAPATMVAVDVVGDTPLVDSTSDGDGYTPWSRIPEVLRPHVQVAPVDHGGLVAAEEIRPAIVELLESGRTERLGSLPTVTNRGVTTRGMALRPLAMIPGDAELVAAGLGIEPRRREGAGDPRVRVRVVHGNLSRAKSPVVVGHYAQDVLANAEAYLDRQLRGRLRELYEMRLYPEAIGSVAVEIQRADTPSGEHPGAIVVGLGVVGELTPGALLETLELGLAKFGAERARRQAVETLEAGSVAAQAVTALLVGSGEAGLSLRDCLHAMLRAVQRANLRLCAPATAARTANLSVVPPTVRIEAIDLLELYEDRAVEALRTLHALSRDTEFAAYFDIEPVLEIGAEGRQRVSFEEPAAWWQRLRINEQDASIDPETPTYRKVLKFEAYSERARIDAYAVNSLREQAGAFIGSAMATTATDQKLGRALFEMLVPNAIKERAPDRRDTVLLLDAAAAAVPWELFEDGLERERRTPRPMAIEAGLVRQLVDDHGRTHARRATGIGALVIGNPTVDDTRFAPLPGAEKEAQAVAEQLRDRYAVTSLVGADATSSAILAALHEAPWRVLHLALHGVFNYPAVEGKAPKVTGAVVARHVYLEAADFNQMRYVPDLVFLNCCHAGNTAGETHTPRYPDLAANLATQFIKMGARAVVAAGWAVDDGAAKAFAQTIYAELLNGRPFGEASLTARREIHRQFPHVNTWGAYQCYGDPAFSLQAKPGDTGSRALLCARELIVEADALANLAKAAEDAGIGPLRKRLDALARTASADWLREARVCAALGFAYGELQEFELAIDYLTRAGQAARADHSVIALEQLANFEVRYAEHLWRDGGAKKSKALRTDVHTRFDRAEDRLKKLIALRPASAECHSLLGGLAKRRAMTGNATKMRAALADMRTHYGQAYDLKTSQKHDDAFYPFVNRVVARLGLSWLADASQPAADVKAAAKELVDGMHRLAVLEQEQQAATEFWPLGFVAEAALLQAIHAGELEKRRADVLENYRRAQRRGRSRREFDSVMTQIRLLALVAAQSELAATRKLRAALTDLASELTGS